MKRILLLLLIGGISAACHRESGGKKPSPTADSSDNALVLQIGDRQWTNDDFKRFVQLQYPSMSQEPGSSRLLSSLFDNFVEQETIIYQADQEKTTVSDDEIADYEKRLEGDSPPANARPAIRDVLIAQKFLYFRVYHDIQVSDREVEAYYNGHIEEYRKSEEILLFQILVNNHDQAVRLRSELLSNPNRFEEIAHKESQSPEAANGGQMGYFERGVLPKEMENIVFSLQMGDISPITETPYGFHIFKVTKIKKKRLLAFATVAPEIRERILSEKLHSAYQQFLAELRRRLKLSIHTEHLSFAYVKSNTDEVKNDTLLQTPAAPADDPGPRP
jgi:peptidyl-prolyl cis-trans isomerase C